MDDKKLKRILIVNPFGIGDVIFSMTLVEALRRALPEARIGFLCNERTADLVRMNPSIDQTFVFHRDAFRELWPWRPLALARKIRAFLVMIQKERFDTMFDLSLGRQYSFFAMLLGIPRRIGLDFKGRGIFLTDKKSFDGYAERHVAETQLELLDGLGVRYDKASLRIPFRISGSLERAAEEELRRKGVMAGETLIAVAPGGGRSWGRDAIYKQWNPERFAEAVRRIGEGRRVKILLLGDESEADLLRRTAALVGRPGLLACGEPLEKVSAYLARCRLLLCNDGGLLHLANALGVPTVGLYGPVDEKVYGPFRLEVPHATLTEPVPCRPCYQKFYFPPCPFERRCLTELGVEKVVSALHEIL